MVDTTWLNVDFNLLELVTNICYMFKTIEGGFHKQVSRNSCEIKNSAHASCKLLTVSTLELSKNSHKKTLVIRTLLDFEFSIFVIFHGSKFENSQLWCFKVSSVFTIISALSKLFKYIQVFMIINDREWSYLISWRNFKMFNFWWLNLRWRGLLQTYRLLLMMHLNES